MDLSYILKAALLAIVEGLTEFLPVSSTGHLIVAADLLKMPQDAFYQMYMIVIQLFAILAVIVLFFHRLWRQISGFFRFEKSAWTFVSKWVLATIPAGLMGLFFNDWIEAHLMRVPTVMAALVLGAILLIVLERWLRPLAYREPMESISYAQALGIGCFQCLALWPGFSRSASTIMGGWVCRVKTRAAADFSFFLAMPIMVLASIYSLYKYLVSAKSAGLAAVAVMNRSQVFALIIGCLLSFIVALVVVDKFLNFLKRHSLRGFAYYRILLAILLGLRLFVFKAA
ncbi:MAG: undecaprenyl-diphosphate phosphatase [Eubacteriales bacterium]|nr:undecaprenyl-diphosphate phosphatase [Eubacteriales bacterium]